ncbi:hypothetical protein QA597_01745 [Marinilabiliaceae bacterium ANBcel2]|nr:hypothetical protein [Marinilabiliaceae bacterium ANBcel2]
MKKFTLLFIGFFAFSLAFAETPTVEVEELWHHGQAGDGEYDPDWDEFVYASAPSWMGGTTERAMTHMDGKIYIASRKDGISIVVLDAETGNQIEAETITFSGEDVSGGTFALNGISSTDCGMLLISNLATNTQSIDEDTEEPSGHFKVYSVDPATHDVETLIEWENVDRDEEFPFNRLGDHITFYGDLNDGYMLAGVSSSPFVTRWNITDNQFEDDPVVIELQEAIPASEGPVNLSFAAMAYPINDNAFAINGHGIHTLIADMEGNLLTTFSDDEEAVRTTSEGAGGVVYFEINNREFIAAAATNWTHDPKMAFQLFEMIDGSLENAEYYGTFPEIGTGDDSNASHGYPMALDILPDNSAVVYYMAPNNGIAAYKVTADDLETFISTPEYESNASIYPNPATDVVNFSVEMSFVEIFNVTGQRVALERNTTSVNVADLTGTFIIRGEDINGLQFSEVVIIK